MAINITITTDRQQRVQNQRFSVNMESKDQQQPQLQLLAPPATLAAPTDNESHPSLLLDGHPNDVNDDNYVNDCGQTNEKNEITKEPNNNSNERRSRRKGCITHTLDDTTTTYTTAACTTSTFFFGKGLLLVSMFIFLLLFVVDNDYNNNHNDTKNDTFSSLSQQQQASTRRLNNIEIDNNNDNETSTTTTTNNMNQSEILCNNEQYSAISDLSYTYYLQTSEGSDIPSIIKQLEHVILNDLSDSLLFCHSTMIPTPIHNHEKNNNHGSKRRTNMNRRKRRNVETKDLNRRMQYISHANYVTTNGESNPTINESEGDSNNDHIGETFIDSIIDDFSMKIVGISSMPEDIPSTKSKFGKIISISINRIVQIRYRCRTIINIIHTAANYNDNIIFLSLFSLQKNINNRYLRARCRYKMHSHHWSTQFIFKR